MNMNKIKVKLLSLLSILFVVFNFNIAYGYNNYNDYKYDYNYDYSYDKEDYDYDYYIKNMNIEVKVNDKREYSITETIDAYFNVRKHGIIRNIPKSSALENYKITDISVAGADYSVSNLNSYADIKIGSEHETVIGDKRYVIKYTLKHYDDGEKDADYLYLNLLGTDWDVPVKNFTSTITYPESFKFKDIKVTSGKYGSTENYYADYTLDSNNIKIQSRVDGLPEYSGITVNIRFEEGAFSNAPVNMYTLYISIIKVVAIILLLTTIISVISSRNKIKSIPKVVEFYPPENMSSIEMSYIYRGIINDESVVSLIYSWASKGYIKIDVDKADRITLTKLKPLDSDDNYENQLFKKIFSYSYGNPPKVSGESLQYRLGETFKKVKKGVISKYRTDDRYNKKSSKIALLVRVVFIIVIIISVILESINILGDIVTSIIIVEGGICIAFISPILKKIIEEGYDNSKSFVKNIFENWCQIIIKMIVFSIVCWYINPDAENLVTITLLFLSLLLSTMIIPNKTEYEEEIYGRICGFKEFLEKAEKDKLEMLIDMDPDYFYNILPYAQALNVTEIWADKFKDIAVNPSENYICGRTASDIAVLSIALTKVSREAAATQSSSSSSSGGFSGGGSSGGGSGGGGGRSW